MSQSRNQTREDRANRPSSYELSGKQWAVVAGVTAAAATGGPVVAATAALGTVGGCCISNAMGWTGDE